MTRGESRALSPLPALRWPCGLFQNVREHEALVGFLQEWRLGWVYISLGGQHGFLCFPNAMGM